MKIFRSVLGVLLIAAGILFTILPGSTLLIVGGLVLMSLDYKHPRILLAKLQRTMTTASRKLDSMMIKRKYR